MSNAKSKSDGGKTSKSTTKGSSFEERLQRLEELSEKIRQGDISLDDAVMQFEEGIKLAKSLEEDLSKVERKVEILINEPDEDSNEKPALELFPELSEMNAGTESEGTDR